MGKQCLSESTLMESFKLYVSAEERGTIEEMMTNFDITDENLIDFLDEYKCKRIPNDKDGFKDVLKELAHQELIQKPKYMGNCFGEVFQLRKMLNFQTPNAISEFLKS